MPRTLRKPGLVALGVIGLLPLGVVISARRTEAQFASPVNVMNSTAAPTNIREADQRAPHPFPAGAPIAITCSPSGIMAVLQHQEAVIEYVSFHGDTEAANAPDLEIGVTQNGFLTSTTLSCFPRGPAKA